MSEAETGPGPYVRDIRFNERGRLAEALGISTARNVEIEQRVHAAITETNTVQGVIEAMNAAGDLNDAEWTAMVFALGHYCARNGH